MCRWLLVRTLPIVECEAFQVRLFWGHEIWKHHSSNFIWNFKLVTSKKIGGLFGPSRNIWITCSWHQKTNSPIHEFKVLHKKPKSLLKLLFNGILVLIYYFKKHFKPCFFILKTFCNTLNSWIVEFVFWCHELVTKYF